jgi:sodium-dependent dicarboxylate transporter 2/3/5
LADLGGAAPAWVVLVGVCLAATLLSEIASNTATAALLLPLMGSMAVSMGQHPLFLMLPIMFATSMGFMMPAATPPNALALGSGYVTVGQLAKAGLALNAAGLTFAIVACYLLGFPAMGVEPGVAPPGVGQAATEARSL